MRMGTTKTKLINKPATHGSITTCIYYQSQMISAYKAEEHVLRAKEYHKRIYKANRIQIFLYKKKSETLTISS
jgi:TfoX/Sxy family transcriptional regulator of competence genes